MEFTNLSLEELRKAEKQLRDAIQSRYEQEKEDIKRQIREIAKRAGTTVEELFGLGGKASRSTKGGKVAPRYRNPSNAAETWTGRGRMPAWMQKKVDGGAKKEDFLIK